MMRFASLFIGSVGLILILLGGYLWLAPKPRISSIANQLFATDTQRADIYLPSEYSWSEGHGLALWKRRGSKRFAIVRKGSLAGKQNFRELGIGRLSLVQEVDAVDQALRLLLEMRSDEESKAVQKFEEEERYKKEQEEIRLKAARARQLENEKRVTACHSEWARHEHQMNQVLQALGGSDWRPAGAQLPTGVTIDEAWNVVSAMIDEFVNDLRLGNIGTDLSDIRTLIFGLVGASDWLSDHPGSNEALVWAAVFSLLSDVKDGREACSVALNKFAKAGHWDLVHGLSVAWARIEADQLDQSRFTPLIECATGALITSWRVNNPADYDTATMPSQLVHELEKLSKATPSLLLPVAGTSGIERIDEFTRFACR